MLEQGGVKEESPFELRIRIEATKTLKSSCEKLLEGMEATNQRQGTEATRVAWVREDLATLRGMSERVARRIEQLQFDAGKARRQR